MPRIFSLLALGTALLGGSFVSDAAHAAPATSVRNLTGAMPGATRIFRSLGALRGSASATRVRALKPGAKTSATKKAQSVRTTAASTDLKLSFDSGFTSAQRAVLNRAANRSLILKTVFGDPSPEQQGKTIYVESDGPSAAAYQPLSKPDAVDGGSIYYRYDGGASDSANEFNFTRLLLLAYQGPHAFSYNYGNGDYIEAWQNGFADAAALLVMYKASTDKPKFDATYLGSYVLPIYDLLNNPELGNAYIYSRTGADMFVSDFRAVMAQSAWLKVAIENPDFFANFNQKYYSQFQARTAVSPSSLRQLAASVAPTVEGLSFNDWFRRQYALDTSVTTGQKLYAAISPFPVTSSANRRAGFAGYVQAFTTDSNGNETPSVGYGTVNAFDDKGANINTYSAELRSSTLLDFTTLKEDEPGQAFFTAYFAGLGSPDAARIKLQFRFNSAETSAVFPYISSTTDSKSTYYGVTANGESGSITVTPNNGTSQTVAVQRGAWNGSQEYVTGPGVVTTLKLGNRTFKRNTAWLIPGAGARGVAFVLDGSATASNFTFKTAAGSSKIRMISLPLNPLESDEATILGVAPESLDLARYRPNLSPSTLKDGRIEFGIGGDRHELYPEISAAMGPGRGYWLGVDGALQRTIPGTEPSRDRAYEVPVLGGWNQIGVPFNRAISPDALKVRYGGFSAVSYSKAVANGWVLPGIWRWKPTGGYSRVDGTNEKLQPFEGYYLYAAPARGVSLVFDPSSTTEPTLAAAGWTITMSAATSVTRDASNRFGVSTAVAAAKPPAAAKVVTLRFLSSGSGDSDGTGAGAESGWADSFMPSLDREGSWSFIVEGTNNKERVTLSWNGVASMPKGLKLTLVDAKTASQLRMTSGSSYKWTSDGKARSFTLKVTRIATPVIALDPVGSEDVRMTVTLNVAAKGRLEIQNGAGDTVAVLKSGTFAANTSKFSWSGKLTNGKRAPAGRYLIVWTPESKDDKSGSRSFNWK
jgi:hypothetical protein